MMIITMIAMMTRTPPTTPPITPALFCVTAIDVQRNSLQMHVVWRIWTNHTISYSLITHAIRLPAITEDELATSEVPKLFTAVA